MPIGRTPVNQLDSLPLVDADSAAAGGEIQIINGVVVRYFSPAVLGIAGATVQSIAIGAGFFFYIAGNYLDLRGCTKFQLLVRRNVILTTGAMTAMQVGFQTRMGVSDNPLPTWILPGLSVNQTLSGSSSVNVTSIIFPAAGTAGNHQSALRTWAANEFQGFGGSAASIGSDCRILFDWSTNPPAIGDGTITAQLWASG